MTRDLLDPTREPDPTDREIVARLRAFVDDLDVEALLAEVDEGDEVDGRSPEPDVEVPTRDGIADVAALHRDRPPGRRPRPRWVQPLLVAAAALLLVAGAVVAPARLTVSTAPAGGGGGITLPERLPGYEHFPIPVSWAPPGRALFSCQSGGDYEFLDWTRHIVVAADARTVRKLPIAEQRTHLGRTAPTAVSPDGRIVAVGTNGWSGDVILAAMDSRDERTVQVTTRPQRSIRPLGWSMDSDTLYVLDVDANHAGDPSFPGLLRRVDAATGAVTSVPGVPDRGDGDVYTVGASDDPGRLLVGQGDTSRIIDLRTGQTLREVPALPGGFAVYPWSPDGRFAVSVAWDSGDGTLSVRDLHSGATREWPTREWPTRGYGLAWVDDDTYLLAEQYGHGSGVGTRLVEVDVETGEQRLVSTWDTSWTDAAVSGLSVAADLIRRH